RATCRGVLTRGPVEGPRGRAGKSEEERGRAAWALALKGVYVYPYRPWGMAREILIIKRYDDYTTTWLTSFRVADPIELRDYACLD
ncbi:hypothetical protein Dimus_012926, partial [Dionaea muscipula]